MPEIHFPYDVHGRPSISTGSLLFGMRSIIAATFTFTAIQLASPHLIPEEDAQAPKVRRNVHEVALSPSWASAYLPMASH